MSNIKLPEHETRGSGDSESTQEIERLREILFGDELKRIKLLEKRLTDPLKAAQDISDVLAEAIAMRSGQDKMLEKALEPVIEGSVKDAIKKHPEEFTTALFPLIGSTIRKSIAESFRAMLGSFSKALESSFSPQGIKWRIEALRTGKPFSEIVMLHTLVYRVEQIFLIHSETGLLISHVFNEGVDSKDADMVSGMFTAIQDFAKDAFNPEGDKGALDSLEMGEHTIYIERGPLAYVACVVRGVAPAAFLVRLRQTLELITAKLRQELSGFNGDRTPFSVADIYLEDCLEERFVDEGKGLPLWAKAVPVLLLVAILTLSGFKVFHTHKMNKVVDIMQSEPGMLLINVKKSFLPRPWQLFCLKDELTPSPTALLVQQGIKPDSVMIKTIPFISYEPDMIKRRVENKIKPPSTVNMKMEGGRLTLTGTADMSWILQARQFAQSTPGVTELDVSGLSDSRYAQLQALVKSVERTIVRFPIGKDTPISQDREALDKAIADLVQLERLAQTMGIAVRLTIYGHADVTGNEKRNYEISQERAKMIAAKLYANKSGIPVTVLGLGSDYAENTTGEDQNSRKINLRIHLSQAADADALLMKR